MKSRSTDLLKYLLWQERKRAWRRERRRKTGMSRDEYELTSISNLRPWRSMGIRRSWWYERYRWDERTGLALDAERRKLAIAAASLDSTDPRLRFNGNNPIGREIPHDQRD